MITLAVCLATVNSYTNDVRVEAPKPPDLCEVHKLPTVQKAMPETPMKGIDDNGYHPETLTSRPGKVAFPIPASMGPPAVLSTAEKFSPFALSA